MPLHLTPPERDLGADCGPGDELRSPGGLRGLWLKVRPIPAAVTRRVTEPILRVGAQGLSKAKQAGHLTARKVFGVQRSANLPERVVERSARSVLERPMPRAADVAWQNGYREVVQRQAPQMFVPKQPEIEHDFELG